MFNKYYYFSKMKKVLLYFIFTSLVVRGRAQEVEYDNSLFYSLDSLVTDFSQRINIDSILNQENVYTRNFPIVRELLKNKDTVYFAYTEDNILNRESIEKDIKKLFGNENLVVVQAKNSSDTIIVSRQIRKNKRIDYIYGYWLLKNGKLYREVITNENKEIRYDISFYSIKQSNHVKYTYKRDELISVQITFDEEINYKIKNNKIVKISYYHNDRVIQILFDSKGYEKSLIYLDYKKGLAEKKFKYPIKN